MKLVSEVWEARMKFDWLYLHDWSSVGYDEVRVVIYTGIVVASFRLA